MLLYFKYIFVTKKIEWDEIGIRLNSISSSHLRTVSGL